MLWPLLHLGSPTLPGPLTLSFPKRVPNRDSGDRPRSHWGWAGADPGPLLWGRAPRPAGPEQP